MAEPQPPLAQDAGSELPLTWPGATHRDGDDTHEHDAADGFDHALASTQAPDPHAHAGSPFFTLELVRPRHDAAAGTTPLPPMSIQIPYNTALHGSRASAFTVGRGGDATLSDPARSPSQQLVSRVHALFVSRASGPYVIPVGATGTLLDGKLINTNQEVLLKHGNTLTFGRENSTPGAYGIYDRLRYRVRFPFGKDSLRHACHQHATPPPSSSMDTSTLVAPADATLGGLCDDEARALGNEVYTLLQAASRVSQRRRTSRICEPSSAQLRLPSTGCSPTPIDAT